MQRGLFLTIEGVDGAGKGTQLEFVESYLTDSGIDFISLREPGGTEIGESIRKILLDKELNEMTAETELLLFNAARAQIVREKIEPTLAEGAWVICDRFYDSTIAYQVGGRGLNEEQTLEIIRFAVGDLEPDHTIYLDLDVESAIDRIETRADEEKSTEDRMESEDIAFKERVRNKYLELAQSEERIHLVSAAASIEEVSNEISNILNSIIKSFKEA